MAVAEGLEPSARGFGADVKHRKPALESAILSLLLQTARKISVPFDALLMMLRFPDSFISLKIN